MVSLFLCDKMDVGLQMNGGIRRKRMRSVQLTNIDFKVSRGMSQLWLDWCQNVIAFVTPRKWIAHPIKTQIWKI